MTFKPQAVEENTEIDGGGDEENQTTDNMSSDLASAIEEVAGKEDESASADGGVPDEIEGMFADPQEAPAGPKAEEPIEKVADKEVVKPDGEGEKPAELEALKAPVDWDPKAREHWSKVPVEVQKHIHDREKMIATTMQDTAVARNTHSAVAQLAQSYAPIMAAEGVSDPIQAISGLFKTVAELRIGSPEQKAVRMAKLIGHYGIDVEALDNALVGQAPAPSQNAQFEHMLNERMAPMNQFLQQMQGMQANNQQQSQQQATDAVAAFQGEFLADVRVDMADLIDMAAKRGVNMPLQEAYDKAVLLKPEIQEVLTKRASDADLLGNQENLAGKRNASSSLSGKQGGDGLQDTDSSLRGTLENAWGDGGGRI